MKKPIFKSLLCIIAISFILLVIPIIQPQIASAAVTSDGYEYSVSGITASITDYTGSGSNLTVPNIINNGVFDYTVTSIGDGAFSGSTSLMSITIPNSVTSIGNYVFAGSSLKSVTIPSSVINIGNSAFNGCGNLVEVQFLGNAPTIGEFVFYGCSSNLKFYYLCGNTGFKNPWYGQITLKIGIEVTTPPTKTDYVVGESLDLNGLVVTGYYNDGTTGIIANSMLSISGFDSSDPVIGQVVTMRINDKTTTFNVKIISKKYIVNFIPNGGQIVVNQSVNYNEKVSKPAGPTKTGYTFGGWYKEAGCINAWNFTADRVTVDTTLYAKWTTQIPVTTVQRLAGVNRIETSIAIAKEQYTDKAPDAIVLATANNFADALAGSGLAYKYNAPLLLVNKTVSNSKTVLEYITTNLSKEKDIYILGGTGAVSSEISDYLTINGYNIIRLGGKDRYETNQRIVDYLKVPKGTSIVITTGSSFADALSISSIADIKGYPILLNGKENLLASVSSDITNIQPTTVYIIGGTGVLSTNIEAQIKLLNANITIVRLGGKDRYETSMKIIEYFNLTTDTITVATGIDFPDALSGSVLAARKNCSVLLVDNKNITEQKELLYTQNITTIIVFGGEGVISNDIVTSLKQPISYTYGNTSGNLTNGGNVVSDGQYNYYLNSSDGYKLYKSKPDGSSKSKISESVCSSLNTIGDWIYYSDFMVGKGIYKIKKDGSSKTLIVNSQTMGIAVVNDWIYYLEKGASESQENFLYKIKTDGTSKKKIDFETKNSLVCIEPQAIVVIENWVYLSLLNKADNNIGLYRIKTDGSTAQRVSTSSPRFFSIEDGWIYYSDDTYQKIKKAKVDGSSEEVLYTIPDSNYALYGLNASNGYVYFSNYTYSQPDDKLGIYRMKTDGSDLVKLVSGSAKFLNIVSEWIYYESPGSSTLTYANGVYTVTIGGSSQILKLKTDGSELFQAN